jgi:predicted enzyme related to lactoylglutathione lyase
MRLELFQRDKLKRRYVCRFEIDRGGAAVIEGIFPSRNAYAPLVAGFQTGEAEFRAWRNEVVAVEHRKIQELLCDFHAHGMPAEIFRACPAKTVAIKSGHRITATTFQFCSQNIGRHKQGMSLQFQKTLPKENAMPIRAKYVHTNLIARDWKKLVRFYVEVFGCKAKGPERDMSGAWLDEVTSIPNAHLSGVHLHLPGYGDDGPTLEIFRYDELIECDLPAPNRCGFGHIAFGVADVEEALQRVIAAGGGVVGKVARTDVQSVGTLRVVYARDPEANIVELQRWT